MALSARFVDAHIADWDQKLSGPTYPHRRYWPHRLFHHTPLENALAILRDGCLRSRNDTENQRPKDVAAPGVIDTNARAHSRVRLYFRPKTPTQWHIEGIRKPGECKFGDATHAAVLVMFVFDARAILTLPDIQFSDRNMQLSSSTVGFDETYFSSIPFHKVFSEGGTGGDRTFTDARCAEVLPASPLELAGSLREIYFRSEPERDTLLHMLGGTRAKWETYCRVSDAMTVFQKEYTFVQTIKLTSKGVIFRLNQRRDLGKVSIWISVWNSQGNKVIDFQHSDHETQPLPPSTNWIFPTPLSDGQYKVEVSLEGHLCYKNTVKLGDSLF